MTESRIDYLIADSGAGMRTDYAQGWITSINPTDFLNLTLLKSNQDRTVFDNMPGDYGSTINDYDFVEGGLKKETRQTPYLAIDVNTGKVVGHEGRHRMRALEKEGITYAEIKIEFRDSDGYLIKAKNGYGNPLKTIGSLRIFNQRDTGQSAVIHNIMPLYKANRENILQHYGVASDGDIKYQQRTNTLTNREVLALAASELQTADLPAAEKDALGIFQQRLAKLEALQEERANQGRLYREQQFGTKVDRAAAEQTRNRMQILDSQIEKAKAEVLSIEDKQVLNRVLQKARKVVEKQQWTKDQETLKRYRDRRNDAAAIKKYRERLTKDVNELTKWVLHPDNKDIVKHVPDVLKSSVIPFLSSIDFTSKQQLRGGDATRSDREFMKRLRGLKTALDGQEAQKDLYEGYTDLPPFFMEKLGMLIDGAQAIVDKKSGEYVVNQMTSQELKELSEVVANLKAYIQNFNRFHANQMMQHVHEAGDSAMEEMAPMATDSGKADGVKKFFLWQQMRPAYIWERFGAGGRAIYDGLRRGQARLAYNTKAIQEFAAKTYTQKEVKDWEKETKTFKLADGTSVTMRVADMMSLYLLSKRKQAQDHLYIGGIRVAKRKKAPADAGHYLTKVDVATITEALTNRQKEVADALQKFMQEQGGQWGNYVSVKRFGQKLFGEDHYFPIHADGTGLNATADASLEQASLYALLNMGFTKPTKEKASNRIMVYSIFDEFATHMSSMAQYNALALPVVDAIKWLNYKQAEDFTTTVDGKEVTVHRIKDSVRAQMDRVYGVPSEDRRAGSGQRGYAQTFVINTLKAFNGTEAQGTPYDSMGLKLLHNYNRAQVAYNLSVAVKQPLAIIRAGLLVDYKSIIKGMKLSPAAIQKNIQEMQQYSGIAAWKDLGFYDVNIFRGVSAAIRQDETAVDKVVEFGMKGAETADKLTWAGIWSACKEEVIRKQGLTPKSEGFYEAVTQLFEDVIYKTQVVDSVLTKSEYMRDKGFFARSLASFMSEPVTTASMVIDSYDKYRRDIQKGMSRTQAWKKNRKHIARVVYVYSINALLTAAVSAAISAWRDDDDYQEWYEKWLEAFWGKGFIDGSLFDEINPLTKLPGVAEAYEIVESLMAPLLKAWTGADLYSAGQQTPWGQATEYGVQAVEIIADKLAGEDTKYTDYAVVYKLLQTASGLLGVPGATATREVVAGWNNTVGAFAPSLKVKTYEPGEKNEIKYAYQDGYLTEEEATAELLEKGLVDNEDEAYWTVQGWEAGDGYSRYEAIYDVVLNGGDFDAAMTEMTTHGYKEDDVLSQVKSKIGQWYYDNESKVRITKQQAIDMLTKYTKLNSEEITATVNKWSSKVVTGIAYDDIDDEFLAGNITEARAKEMYIRYGGLTEEKAHETVHALAFVEEHPDCEGIGYKAVVGYETHAEEKGVEAGTFYDVWKYYNKAESDRGENDEIICGPKDKAMDYIHTLDLSKKQKNAIYLAMGWSKNELYKAPWN